MTKSKRIKWELNIKKAPEDLLRKLEGKRPHGMFAHR
jgi:hypothetical protein